MRAHDDHLIFLLCNLPTAGVIPAAKLDFVLTSVTNLLTMYKKIQWQFLCTAIGLQTPGPVWVWLGADVGALHCDTYFLNPFSQASLLVAHPP